MRIIKLVKFCPAFVHGKGLTGAKREKETTQSRIYVAYWSISLRKTLRTPLAEPKDGGTRRNF